LRLRATRDGALVFLSRNQAIFMQPVEQLTPIYEALKRSFGAGLEGSGGSA
jgi:hypothetical protein